MRDHLQQRPFTIRTPSEIDVTRLPQGKHEDLPWHVCEHANLPIADQPDERKCDHPTKPWHKLVHFDS